MGVYGMLAMGFLVFVARYFIPQDRAGNLARGISFWSLNVGLAARVFITLVPVGFLQFQDSLQSGYWHARSPEFYAQPLVRALEWARRPGASCAACGLLARRPIRRARRQEVCCVPVRPKRQSSGWLE